MIVTDDLVLQSDSHDRWEDTVNGKGKEEYKNWPYIKLLDFVDFAVQAALHS